MISKRRRDRHERAVGAWTTSCDGEPVSLDEASDVVVGALGAAGAAGCCGGATTVSFPTALRDFMSLPPQYTERPGVTGTTPADDLVRQLQLLDEGANELQDLVYTGDAAQLAIQARFLDAKFRRSDLD